MNTRQLVTLFLGLVLAVGVLTVEPYQETIPYGPTYVLGGTQVAERPTLTFVDKDRNGLLLALVVGTTIGLLVVFRNREQQPE